MISAEAQNLNLKQLSDQVNTHLQKNGDRLPSPEHDQVIELLNQIKQVSHFDDTPVDPVIPPPTVPTVIATEVFLMSRKSGGEWISMYLTKPAKLTQLSLHAIGNGRIRIRSINLIGVSGKNISVEAPRDYLLRDVTKSLLLEVDEAITHIQILGEAYSATMNLGIDAYAIPAQQIYN